MIDIESLSKLREEMQEAHRAAESAAHKYAIACPLGAAREKAFEIFENIRVATRVG